MGNRLTQTAPSGTTNYSYDANNRLISAASVTYSYDPNGNLTSNSSGQSFAWDVFNRMTSATGGGGTATYTYNGDGLKIRRIGPDGTTRYYHDGIRPIWEADGAGNMTAQLDRDIFGNLLSRKEPAGTRRYYHFDGLGSTTALSDEGGANVASLLYDAWGNQRAATGAAVSNYRFTGAELDTASGFYHMGARFYDPAIGRWLSEDPAGVEPFRPDTLNAYTYIENDPQGSVDPTGSDPAELDPGTGGSDESIANSAIKKLLAAIASGNPAKLREALQEFLDYLSSLDPVRAGQIAAWVSAIAGTLSLAATAAGQPHLALGLGIVAAVATAASIVFTHAAYKRGLITKEGYIVSQAFNATNLLLGSLGLTVRTFEGAVTTGRAIGIASAVMARPISYGGVALAHYAWKQAQKL